MSDSLGLSGNKPVKLLVCFRQNKSTKGLSVNQGYGGKYEYTYLKDPYRVISTHFYSTLEDHHTSFTYHMWQLIRQRLGNRIE
jgi:hypothetical protein